MLKSRSLPSDSFLCLSPDWLSQRVMMQIVQELCKRPGLNKCGFDMPTIYIPNPNKVRVSLPLSSTWRLCFLNLFSRIFISTGLL